MDNGFSRKFFQNGHWIKLLSKRLEEKLSRYTIRFRISTSSLLSQNSSIDHTAEKSDLGQVQYLQVNQAVVPQNSSAE